MISHWNQLVLVFFLIVPTRRFDPNSNTFLTQIYDNYKRVQMIWEIWIRNYCDGFISFVWPSYRYIDPVCCLWHRTCTGTGGDFVNDCHTWAMRGQGPCWWNHSWECAWLKQSLQNLRHLLVHSRTSCFLFESHEHGWHTLCCMRPRLMKELSLTLIMRHLMKAFGSLKLRLAFPHVAGRICTHQVCDCWRSSLPGRASVTLRHSFPSAGSAAIRRAAWYASRLWTPKTWRKLCANICPLAGRYTLRDMALAYCEVGKLFAGTGWLVDSATKKPQQRARHDGTCRSPLHRWQCLWWKSSRWQRRRWRQNIHCFHIIEENRKPNSRCMPITRISCSRCYSNRPFLEGT